MNERRAINARRVCVCVNVCVRLSAGRICETTEGAFCRTPLAGPIALMRDKKRSEISVLVAICSDFYSRFLRLETKSCLSLIFDSRESQKSEFNCHFAGDFLCWRNDNSRPFG